MSYGCGPSFLSSSPPFPFWVLILSSRNDPGACLLSGCCENLWNYSREDAVSGELLSSLMCLARGNVPSLTWTLTGSIQCSSVSAVTFSGRSTGSLGGTIHDGEHIAPEGTESHSIHLKFPDLSSFSFWNQQHWILKSNVYVMSYHYHGYRQGLILSTLINKEPLPHVNSCAKVPPPLSDPGLLWNPWISAGCSNYKITCWVCRPPKPHSRALASQSLFWLVDAF